MEMSSTTRICKYCNQVYCNKSSLSRHINYFCNFVPTDIKKDLALKQEQRKEKKKFNTEEISTRHTINITNNIDKQFNDNKQINITFVNICGSNVPVDVLKSIQEINESAIDKLREYIPNLLQPFGSEDLSRILVDEEKLVRYFNDFPSTTFRVLLNDIHNFDENRNFGIPNVKHAIVQYVNENFDISKANKLQHIRDIQERMHEVYTGLLNKYKTKIRPRYYQEHEVFLKNMLRRHDDIVSEFNHKAEFDKLEKIKRLKKEAYDNDEDFDDRSIINEPLPICHIPDYNRITTEIIETYLTTNSKINVQFMNDHKTKVSAIKSAIGTKPRLKTITLEDMKEADRLEEKKKKAIAKMQKISALESAKQEWIAPIVDRLTYDDDTITSDEEDSKILSQLEMKRGIDF